MQKPPFTFEEFLCSQDLVSPTAYYFNYPCVWWSEHAGVRSWAKPCECEYWELSLSIDCISETLRHWKLRG